MDKLKNHRDVVYNRENLSLIKHIIFYVALLFIVYVINNSKIHNFHNLMLIP